VLQVTLPTNFKAARFESDEHTAMLRSLQADIEAARFDPGTGPVELPVKLKVHESVFVPLAKWAMLLTGNYRCVTPEGVRAIKDAVHSDVEQSRSVYDWVRELCVALGAKPDDLVPFEKYAAAAKTWCARLPPHAPFMPERPISSGWTSWCSWSRHKRT
jgi:hypothetical protein